MSLHEACFAFDTFPLLVTFTSEILLLFSPLLAAFLVAIVVWVRELKRSL